MAEENISIQLKKLLTEAIVKKVKKRKKSIRKILQKIFPAYEKTGVPEDVYNDDIDYMSDKVLRHLIKYLNLQIYVRVTHKEANDENKK